MLDATPNQLAYISNLLDQLPEESEERLEYAAVIQDYDRPPSKRWCSEAIDELKVKIAKASQQPNEPLEKGRLAPSERLNETPAERWKRIYRVIWRQKGLSLEGFNKQWAEKGHLVLRHHGVAT